MAIRFDKATLKPPIKSPDGRVRVDSLVTRSGVFTYMLPDGTKRREYRPPAEVFDAESLATFAFVPVTNDHPPEMVSAQNARQYTVGMAGEQARRDGDYVRLSLNVFDAETIAAMENGKVQISVGYHADLDMTPGSTPAGERFDAIQKNIRVNHVALVDEGRAGPEARVRFDAATLILDEGDTPGNLTTPAASTDAQSNQADPPKPKDDTMDELEQAKAQIATLEAALKEATDKLAAIQGERDALQAQSDKADKERNDALSSIEPRVRARVALENQVKPHVEGDISAMSDRQLKLAAIKKLDGVDIAASENDTYVNGYFASAIKRADAARETTETVRAAAATARQDAGKEEDPRAAMLARQSAAYKPVGKGN